MSYGAPEPSNPNKIRITDRNELNIIRDAVILAQRANDQYRALSLDMGFPEGTRVLDERDMILDRAAQLLESAAKVVVTVGEAPRSPRPTSIYPTGGVY